MHTVGRYGYKLLQTSACHLENKNVDNCSTRIHTEGLTGEQVSVDIRSDTLVVRITNAQGALDHCLDMKLFAEVDPAASRWTLLRTKVRLFLYEYRVVNAGQHV